MKLFDVESGSELKVNKVMKTPPSCISFCESGTHYAVAATGKGDNFAIRI